MLLRPVASPSRPSTLPSNPAVRVTSLGGESVERIGPLSPPAAWVRVRVRGRVRVGVGVGVRFGVRVGVGVRVGAMHRGRLLPPMHGAWVGDEDLLDGTPRLVRVGVG